MDIQDIKNNMLPLLQQIMELEVTDENREAISDIAEAFEDVMDKFFPDELEASHDGVDLDVGETPLIVNESEDDEDEEFADDENYNEAEEGLDNSEEDVEITTTQDVEHLTVDQLRKLMTTCINELSTRAEDYDDDEDSEDEDEEDGYIV